MRYFNLKQFTEPRSMFTGDRLVDINDLERVGKEITKEQAEKKPNWGSGNLSVNENGEWKWLATDFDSSG